MGDKNFQILCVNLTDPQFEEMERQLHDGVAAHRRLFTEQEVIKETIGQYRAVYFLWDGLTANAHRMIQNLRRHADKTGTKLCVLLDRPDSNLAIAKKRVAAYEWIDLPRDEKQLQNLVNKAFANLQNKSHISNVVFDFRSQWQPFHATKVTKTQNEWTAFVKAIQDSPGNKSYWSLSDSVLYWLTRGETSKAQKLYDQLRKAYQNEFDCAVIGAFLSAKNGGLREAANTILSIVNAHKDQLTSSPMFRVGMALARWKMQDQLMSLLEFWYESDSLPNDHHLWFVVSLFHTNNRDEAKRKCFLFPAVAKAPLRGQYLVEMARFLVDLGEFRKAAVMFQFAARCHDTNKVECLLEATRAFIKASRHQDASQVLGIAAEIVPSHQDVIKLRNYLNKHSSAA